MSRFACITRLAYNIAVLIRKRLLKEKTLCGSWAIYQWYKQYGNVKYSECVLKETVVLRRHTSFNCNQSWR